MKAEKNLKGGPRYMLATKAMHKLGDISSDVPNLCYVYGEDSDNFIGNWVVGFGFFDVKFPKSTTRELTEEEKDKYDGKVVAVGSQGAYVISTKNVPKEAIVVKTRNSTYHLGKHKRDGARAVSRADYPLNFKRCKVLFLCIGKGMKLELADEPGTVWLTTEVVSIE